MITLEEVKKDMQKRIDKINEKTKKDVKMCFEDFNNFYITIDGKKFDFMIPREMQGFIDGMYFILK